jgi:hypothetical protein
MNFYNEAHNAWLAFRTEVAYPEPLPNENERDMLSRLAFCSVLMCELYKNFLLKCGLYPISDGWNKENSLKFEWHFPRT